VLLCNAEGTPLFAGGMASASVLQAQAAGRGSCAAGGCRGRQVDLGVWIWDRSNSPWEKQLTGKGCRKETGCPGDGSSFPPAMPGFAVLVLMCVSTGPGRGAGKNLPSLCLPHCRGAQQPPQLGSAHLGMWATLSCGESGGCCP